MVTSDLKGCFSSRLQSHAKLISSAVQTLPEWNQGAGGIQAVKFTDPEAHPLELLQFPAHKGHPPGTLSLLGYPRPWASITAPLESAIRKPVCASIAIYLACRSRAGVSIMALSRMAWTVWIRPWCLDQTMVEITSFRPVGGDLGIEFLNYQQPVGGRNRLDTQITDLCDKKILIESSSLERQHAVVVLGNP